MKPIWEKIKALFSNTRLDREFDDELAGHIELLIDEGVQRGLTRAAARRQAMQRLGGVQNTRELHRETRGVPMIETIVQDLRYALRSLRKTPAFTAVVVASLALGIGANTAVFTLIHAALLRPLPAPHPEELVEVSAAPVFSFAMYRDVAASQQVFTGITASAPDRVRLTIPGAAGSATLDNISLGMVTANFFAVLELQPQIGRFFTVEDDRNPESADSEGSVAILSDSLWTRQFGRDPAVLGKLIQVNRSACRIVGVAPRGFTGNSVDYSYDLFVPVTPFSRRDHLEGRGGMFTLSLARLKPGVTIVQARKAMAPVYQRLLAAEWVQYPQWKPRNPKPIQDYRLTVRPAASGLGSRLRHTYSKPLWIVMAIVAAVLLIACANVANLLLARSTWRRREFSLRLALGCGRGRLIRQLLTESVLLAVMGALAGVAISYRGSQALTLMADAGTLDLRPDATVLAFLAAMAVLTAIGFGLAPAWRAGNVDLSAELTGQARGGTGRHVRQRLNRTLVVTQVALSLALLIGAGLLIRTIYNLRSLDPGFSPEHVVIFDMTHKPRDRQPAALASVAQQVHDRVRRIPGVRSSSVSAILLFSGADQYAPLRIEEYPASLEKLEFARFNYVSAGYLETVGMTILEGRGIGEQDTSTAPRAAVINQSMARKYFPNGNPIGRVMEIAEPGKRGRTIQIVGIVRDARYNSLRAEIKPMFYMSIQQSPRTLRGIEVRTTEPASAIAAAVRRAVLDVTPDLMIRRVATLDAQVDETIRPERMLANLCVAFGIIALLLAGVGLYGVLAYSVARRTGEIGIRMALGATQAAVLRLVLGQSVAVVAGGLAVGIALALAATRLIATFLYGLTPWDAATISGATGVLVFVAAIAAWLPARRATKVDPMVALRHE